MKRYWRRLHAKMFVSLKLKFIDWFYDKFSGKYCWADCVAWAYNSGRFNPFNIDKSLGCEEESKTHPCESCYCGIWNNGRCYSSLSEEEKEEMFKNSPVSEDLPF